MTTIEFSTEGAVRITYQATMTVSIQAWLLTLQAVHTARVEAKARWRKLSDAYGAVLVLAILRHDQRPDDLAPAYDVSADTVRRQFVETVQVLARRPPRLDRAITGATRTNTETLLLDGTCIPIETPTGRRAARQHWCAKHKAHHLRVMTLTTQSGRILWTSAAQPARTHETTQAKRLQLPRRLRHANDHGANLGLICDRAHTRLDDQPDNPTVITGRRACRNHKLTPAELLTNQLLNTERAGNEHAHAHLKNWRFLTRLRHGWARDHATTIIRAISTLTRAHVNR